VTAFKPDVTVICSELWCSSKLLTEQLLGQTCRNCWLAKIDGGATEDYFRRMSQSNRVGRGDFNVWIYRLGTLDWRGWCGVPVFG
jgi:hypothetical protein